jgi:hypothetical protein
VSRGIPSKSYYHEGDLDSITAQERMALFKLFIDPEDRIALRWLLGFGSNDFRAGAYRRLRTQCEQTGTTPWQLMCQLAAGAVRIPNTNHLVARFQEIRAELAALQGADCPKSSAAGYHCHPLARIWCFYYLHMLPRVTRLWNCSRPVAIRTGGCWTRHGKILCIETTCCTSS